MSERPFTFEIPGPPVPKGRPRRGKGGGVYTPPETAAAEESIAWEARATRRTFDMAVEVELVFHESRRRGDLDNLVKTVLDGMQKGGMLANDSQVERLRCSRTKVGAGAEKTVVTVRPA